MIIQDFKEKNFTFTAPPDMPDCQPLPVFTDGSVSVSCWLPTAEELEAIMAGGPVWLLVYGLGGGHPPVSVTAIRPFQESK